MYPVTAMMTENMSKRSLGHGLTANMFDNSTHASTEENEVCVDVCKGEGGGSKDAS